MRIVQAFTFEAAHRLPFVPDSHRCKRLHGHSYRVELVLEGDVNPETGFVIDFFDLEDVFGPVLKTLDHHFLNEIPGLENPTAEHISMWIWDKVKGDLPELAMVRLFETPQCWAEYTGD